MSQKLREEKAKEKYNYDMNNAKVQFDADSNTYRSKVESRKNSFELALKMTPSKDSVEELINDSEKIFEYITGVKEPEFKIPENPIKESNVTLLS